MLKKLTALVLVAIMLFSVGCYTHVHVVGNGPQGSTVETARQWYALWGLIPLGDIDTNAMAGTANYKIQTSQTPLDIIINFFTGIVTVYSRTVTVTK